VFVFDLFVCLNLLYFDLVVCILILFCVLIWLFVFSDTLCFLSLLLETSGFPGFRIRQTTTTTLFTAITSTAPNR
jgi:hypothetical protein